MKKFRVLVRGENFLINIDDVEQKHGFYTTRYVEAQDEEAAEYAVMNMLRRDPKLAKGVFNDKSDPPMMYAEEVEEMDSLDRLPSTTTGFAFYPDEKEA
jgi:hypothetical protein